MKAELIALRQGEMSFDEFAVATRREWRGLALMLLRRWEAPFAVDADDLVQELLVAAWQAVGSYDPEHKGRVTLKRYVVYSAVDKAKKWLHSQRKAYRGSDLSPSRLHTPLLSDELEAMVQVPANQEQVAMMRERYATVMSVCYTRKDELVLEALTAALGSTDVAVANLYADPAVRRVCRFNSQADARRAVTRTVARVRRRAPPAA